MTLRVNALLTLLALSLCLGACRWAQRRAERSPAEQAIATGDRAFAQRAEPGQLDLAIEAYLRGLDDEPEHPGLLWRLARAHTTRADTEAEDEGRGYGTARELGLRCLLVSPTFRGLVTASGGVVTPRAVEAVSDDLQPCLLWTGLAWARWLELRGVAGASLDLEVVTAIAERALALDPAAVDGLPLALAGLVAALPPEPLHPDLTLAERRLQAAWRAQPPNLRAGVDLAALVYGPRGDLQAWQTTLTDIASVNPPKSAPNLLEQRAAVAHAKRALASGSPASGWWSAAGSRGQPESQGTAPASDAAPD